MIIHKDCSVQTVRCALPECDEVKVHELNHWFAMLLVAGGDGVAPALTIVPWPALTGHQALTANQIVWAVCGSAHAQKMLEKYLATGKL